MVIHWLTFVSNDQTGADTLIKRMLEAAEKSQVKQLEIGMRTTNQYRWQLDHYLKYQLKGYAPVSNLLSTR